MIKKAFITGVTGQDGSYLAELLLSKGYEVHGLVRRSSTFNTQKIQHLYKDFHDPKAKLFLHYGDLTDGSRLVSVLSQVMPDEIYNLAAQSHVRVSFDEPEYTGDTTALGTTRLLEAMREACPSAKFYQASSSEMYGGVNPSFPNFTSFYPKSPYAISKVYSYWTVRNYREAYGLFCVNGILFNHESPRRGETFVTRKITRAVARIQAGEQSELYLGNLEARRDWGYAPEYVIAMWRMLQVQTPADYVISTGIEISVGDFLRASFEAVGLEWEEFVRFDPLYLRPTEVNALVGDSSMAHQDLSWSAETHPLELAKIMVEYDIATLSNPQVDVPKSKMWKKEASIHHMDQ